ncbi:bifunctional phosphoribosylaminoimidazolecarboxamide formyltransferase/IMP cyclohydrolase [Thermomicrobium sp. 4228-Ro]|uniref:bifunctional phosphoribosylaminoimidazolecarboxamide formyltransferase/IMP cyclohydrolase n=1 Tax=Thermomicrobium sp. 4228-Ro TaxID=2993937 RepID=UPI00224994AA|nr:bifunctional phosphoribosylaminoimidazolecarboxamide formyltransferase/IMP cyclohydrolase [Thermomicrobium sp. 4228-Ro]MCX2726056.1 bifunctional phosphoribosylaminoimidazolecarboxamide formyltransferase/IMP cyclohydrolase [Thermomicrobium sp. 4228-Ro]
MRALLSVSDKSGVVEFARQLLEFGCELVSTGGTARLLREHGLPVLEVADFTGFPELLEGRVKTLHPAVHAAILARRDEPSHMEQLARFGYQPIDLVVVNLYPFDRVVHADTPEAEALELIDIGGPTLLRAAAKNYRWVLPIVDPNDYGRVAAVLAAGGPAVVPLEFRRELAAKAFAHVAVYDAQIAAYLRHDQFPDLLPLPLEKLRTLRYGENPHQVAALYRIRGYPAQIGSWRTIGEVELSYNNVQDAAAAWQLVWRFEQPAAVIVKHAAPCGAAIGETIADAVARAFDADPVSAFGGIVALNRHLDEPVSRALAQHLFDIIIAPSIEPTAEALLRRRKALRIVLAPPWCEPPVIWRTTADVALVQTPDIPSRAPQSWRRVTTREPSEREWEDLVFAWTVVPFVLSNGVVIARDQQTVGIGGGQPNRVDAVRLALWRAGDRARGAVLASDAFFPFPDGVEVAAAAGITAIVQPGGSKRDSEVIAAAERAGIAMVFTGERHFRH